MSLIAQNWPERFSLNFVSTLSTPFKVFLQSLKKFLCLGAEIEVKHKNILASAIGATISDQVVKQSFEQ